MCWGPINALIFLTMTLDDTDREEALKNSIMERIVKTNRLSIQCVIIFLYVIYCVNGGHH